MYKHDNPQSFPALKDGVSSRSFMKNIFNTENTYSNTMVVLGEEPGLFDTIHKPHPFLWDKYKEAVSFNWSEDEFSFIECAAQFAKGDDVAAIMIDTLAWQWEADSIVSHTLLPLVAPFISNSELNACMAFNTYMECLTPEHEVYVKGKGWTWIKDIKVGDTVLQYNPNSDVIEFATVQGTIAKPYKDDILVFQDRNRHVSQKTTKGHRMPVKPLYRDEGPVYPVLAKDVKYSPRKAFPVSARKIGRLCKLTPFDKFRIAFQADGGYAPEAYNGKRTGYVHVRFSFKKVRKINEFEKLLAELDFEWSEVKNNHPAKVDYKTFYVKVPLDVFDRGWKSFDWIDIENIGYEWCREFIDYSKHWDGCDRTKVKGKRRKTLVTYSTKSKECADVYTLVAHLAGYRASWYLTANGCYQITVLDISYVTGTHVTKTPVPYDGMVYCITVPSSAFLVRHEGIVQITFNCCHSACYSEIVRESFPDHESIIKTILDKQQAFERVSIAGEILQELHDVGHRYALGQVSREEAFPTVYMGMLALYLLERLQFIASFAITFAIGEAGLFQPIAMAVRKICSDEIQIHAEVDLYVLKEMQKMPWYEQAMENGLGNRVLALVNDVIQGEMEWTDKLFEGRSMVGVNAGIIKDWVQFNAQIVKQELGLPWENLVKENPIPWINGWITLNNLQAAPQEQDMAQYLMGAVDTDLDGLDDIDI